ncbi:MAG: ribulose-phosphate 3-epimerase [Mycoplasmataceae bacterium]|jgi:ribulose-phosphate 3-epimerase|nr:ribulose-phosphate 3-epimerase [Mycoplasmataceae bacterium]
MKVIEPSLLAFNIDNIKNQLIEVKDAGATFIHYDVMDGKYVVNKTWTTEHLNLINDLKMKSNVHLMVEKPFDFINDFIKFPVNLITFHPEVCSEKEIQRCFDLLTKHHIKKGLTIRLETNIDKYLEFISKSDYVCVMSVTPGKGGQLFEIKSIDNLKKINQIKKNNPNLIIQLDGGVNCEVIKQTSNLVDHFIIGSFLMKQNNKKQLFDFVKSL